MNKIPILFFIILTSCAYPKRTSQYEVKTPSAGKALVYIYRTPTNIDSLNPELPKFYINDETIGKLAIGGYYLQVVDPGEIKVSYKNSLAGFYLWQAQEIKFTALANKKYFIKYSIESLMRLVTFKEVTPTLGEEEIKSTLLLAN